MRIARGYFFPVQQFDICCFRSVMKGLLQLSFELLVVPEIIMCNWDLATQRYDNEISTPTKNTATSLALSHNLLNVVGVSMSVRQ